jgi:glycosyltransferase involved in cell wall biosynthesis
LEDNLLRAFDTTLVCSAGDRYQLHARVPSADVRVVPNCVPLRPVTGRRDSKDSIDILFVGSMNYPPNIDAVKWFCHDVWPTVRDNAVRKCRFFIVGYKPPEVIRSLFEPDSVIVTGGVDSVDPYYAQSDVVVAPIRFGGGTRIKILEAMSMAKPVISTTIGAEGIETSPGADIIIADTASDFADACLDLMGDSSMREDLGRAARTLVEAQYSEDAIHAGLLKILLDNSVSLR